MLIINYIIELITIIIIINISRFDFNFGFRKN